MAFNPYYQNPYYPQPMPDNLMQMRQQQMMQPAPPPVPQNPVATGGVQWVSSEQVEFVTREEFDRLAALVGELKGKKKRKVEEDEDDE